MNNVAVSDEFKQLTLKIRGEKGLAWAETLTNLMTYCEERFGIIFTEEMHHLSFNYVCKALWKDDARIVVKFGFPGKETKDEIKALELMDGKGIVKLLGQDAEKGIMLLEECQPGNMLSTFADDEKATRIAASVMRNIWRPAPERADFPTTHDWFSRLNKPIDLPSDFSEQWVDRAREIAADLHKNQEANVLLHGDLHHFNVLSAEREPWLAIDPKGVVGVPEYEIGAFLRNPMPGIAVTPNLQAVLGRRVDIFSEMLGVDKQAVISWAFAQAVLSAVWSVDSEADHYPKFLVCADVLYKIGLGW